MTQSMLDTVVVGCDGSAGSERALEWAAGEARRRMLRLHIVHVWSPPPLLPIGHSGPPMADNRAILKDAVARAHAIGPDVVVTTQSLPGPVAAAFIDASVEADAVVIGAQGHRRQGFRDFGSTAWQVAIHALSPVVIVPERADTENRRAVVVGVDGSPGAGRALEYAFRSAADSDAELVAVYGWQAGPLGATPAELWSPSAHAELEEAHADRLSRWLTPLAERHRTVPVREVAVRRPAVEALLEEGLHARLIVVGSRGRDGVRGALLGSVGMGLLRRSDCPMTIVRN